MQTDEPYPFWLAEVQRTFIDDAGIRSYKVKWFEWKRVGRTERKKYQLHPQTDPARQYAGTIVGRSLELDDNNMLAQDDVRSITAILEKDINE